MKKILIGTGTCLAVALFLFVLWAGVFPPASVSASAAGQADYKITQYAADMELSSNRFVAVTETLSVVFLQREKHGIIRDFPLDSGVRYKNVTALLNGKSVNTYTQNDDYGYLSFYIGDTSVSLSTGTTYVYTISYTMLVPALSEEGYLPLDVIGYGWSAEIAAVSASVSFPEGLNGYAVYSGAQGAAGNSAGVTASREGNTIILTADYLGVERGITLDLSFAAGVLTTSADGSIWTALLIGAAAVLIAVLAKLLFCRQPEMIETVNLTAPDEMDPLRMGKLIDNKIDSEDLGALVFWFASEGYLTIDLSAGEDDPLLIKTDKPLPAQFPPHCREFYEGLFYMRESVRVSQLENSFYRTVDAVKTQVNATADKMYEKKSRLFLGALAVLSVLLCGGFCFLYALATVTAGYYFWYPLPGALLSFAPAAACSYICAQRTFKWSFVKKLGFSLLGLAGGIALGAFVSVVPCAAFGYWTKFLPCVCAAAAGSVGGAFLIRTKEYSEKLGHILGFKRFILFTERDKIEFMLKDNPELYYKVLPYAQVLGVTDAWTDKFKGLDVAPPPYASGNAALTLILYASLFRRMNMGMARHMGSRPSPKGGGGVHRGGFGGGFGGGGFGGGGGRSF